MTLTFGRGRKSAVAMKGAGGRMYKEIQTHARREFTRNFENMDMARYRIGLMGNRVESGMPFHLPSLDVHFLLWTENGSFLTIAFSEIESLAKSEAPNDF